VPHRPASRVLYLDSSLAVGCILRDLGSNAGDQQHPFVGLGPAFSTCADGVSGSARWIWSTERQNRKNMLNRSAVVSIPKSQVKSRAEFFEGGLMIVEVEKGGAEPSL
jgi:hypothetical protein